MEIVVGVVLGVVVGFGTTWLGMHRDRALYPAILIVVGSYYVLCAVMGGSTQALIIELAAGAVFVGLAVVGFKSTLWLAAAGLIGHGLFDIVHSLFIENAGVPVWWPGFCSSIDVALGAYLTWLLWRKAISPYPRLPAFADLGPP